MNKMLMVVVLSITAVLLGGCVTDGAIMSASLSVESSGYYDDAGYYHYGVGENWYVVNPNDYYYISGGLYHHHFHDHDQEQDIKVTIVPYGYNVAAHRLYFPSMSERNIRLGNQWKTEGHSRSHDNSNSRFDSSHDRGERRSDGSRHGKIGDRKSDSPSLFNHQKGKTQGSRKDSMLLHQTNQPSRKDVSKTSIERPRKSLMSPFRMNSSRITENRHNTTNKAVPPIFKSDGQKINQFRFEAPKGSQRQSSPPARFSAPPQKQGAPPIRTGRQGSGGGGNKRR